MGNVANNSGGGIEETSGVGVIQCMDKTAGVRRTVLS